MEIRDYTINLGPQHPSTHGVLRLILELDGEVVVNAFPQIGFLHRGTEKLIENRTYNKSIGYMDRLDYLSVLCNEHAYVLAIEKLLKIEPPIRAKYIRVLFDEISRIFSHLIWLGTHALDIGAMTVFLYCIREREKLIDCYEAVSGARMNATYYRVGGVYRDLPDEMPKYTKHNSKKHTKKQIDKLNEARFGSLLDFIFDFAKTFPKKIDEYETLLTDNRIWKQRTVGIGVVSLERALQLGFSGPMLRGSGLDWDLRKKQPYEIYDKLDFSIPVGTKGDCYDRYLVKIEEMRQSSNIILQCVEWLRNNQGPVMQEDSKVFSSFDKDKINNDMERLINHFKLSSEGYCVPKGETYTAIEHPKGEFGIYMVSDGANKPYRVKIRAAGFAHLSAMNEMAKGHMLSDVIAIIGSQDVVFGEIDR